MANAAAARPTDLAVLRLAHRAWTPRRADGYRPLRRPTDNSDTEWPALREGMMIRTLGAVLRVEGDTHNLEPAALYLYRNWLPASGEEMRDFPIYCERFFLDAPEQGTAAELFLPLR